MRDNIHKLMLLQTIRVNGRVDFLINNGFSFSKINKFIEDLRSQGFLVGNSSSISLSDKGNKYFQYLCRKENLKGLYKSFYTDNIYRSIKIEIDEVYIPNMRIGTKK